MLTMMIGVTTDLLVYSLIVPIIPFQLESLGYTGVSGLVGWLLFAYVSWIPPPYGLLPAVNLLLPVVGRNCRLYVEVLQRHSCGH